MIGSKKKKTRHELLVYYLLCRLLFAQFSISLSHSSHRFCGIFRGQRSVAMDAGLEARRSSKIFVAIYYQPFESKEKPELALTSCEEKLSEGKQ